MYHKPKAYWKQLLISGIEEDGATWDWTTQACSTEKIIQAKLIAKSSGIWVGQDATFCLPTLSQWPLEVIQCHLEGQAFKSGDTLAILQGQAYDLLRLERPYINLVAYASAIATQTQAFVHQVKAQNLATPPRITCTRKILPHYRDLAIYSVFQGGGHSHRIGLSSGILIKENHIAAAGSIEQAIIKTKAHAPHGLKIEVEVQNLGELRMALDCHAEGILLDNFTPNEVSLAIQIIKTHSQKPFIEVSGGLTLENIAEYCQPGVSVLSVGALTHSVRSLDLSFLVSA